MLALQERLITVDEESKFSDFYDLLKANGYNSWDEFFKKWNEYDKKFKPLSDEGHKLEERFKQIKKELDRDPVTCPQCDGKGSIVISVEWIDTDTGREEVPHFEECSCCNGRGKVPQKELLDP